MAQQSASAENTSAGTLEPASKGKATPKRKEAEAAKPKGLREQVARQNAKKSRFSRSTPTQARPQGPMRPADQGPVRAWARDYVDSRVTMGELMMKTGMVLAFSSIILSLFGYESFTIAVSSPLLFMMLGTVLWAFWFGFFLKRKAAAKFPKENVKGVGLYASVRSIQLRLARIPHV